MKPVEAAGVRYAIIMQFATCGVRARGEAAEEFGGGSGGRRSADR